MAVGDVYRQFRQIGSRIVHSPSAARRSREFRQAKLKLCSADLPAAEIRMLGQASLKVSASDQMYGPRDSAVDYLTAGLSAIRCIEAALDAAGHKGPIKSLLDFPCGYGRELRFLKVRFPESTIVGGEVDTAMLDFCKRTFSVDTVVSEGDFDHLAFPRKFDLIWCGSLMTHLNETSTAGLLGCFYRHLLEGGTCIFTAHGERIANMIQSKTGWAFNMTPEGEEEILRDYRQCGYGFAHYRGGRKDYGTSLTSRARIGEMARSVGNWKEALYLENGWHGSQDLYAFTRPSSNPR